MPNACWKRWCCLFGCQSISTFNLFSSHTAISLYILHVYSRKLHLILEVKKIVYNNFLDSMKIYVHPSCEQGVCLKEEDRKERRLLMLSPA